MSRAKSTPNATESGPAAARNWRPVALAALTAVLIGLCLLLLVPFLPALTWGVALAVVAWPLQVRITRHIPRRGLAAALTTVIVVVVLVVPGLFVAHKMAQEAASAAARMNADAAATTVRDKLAEAPGMAGVVAWLDRVGVNLDNEVQRLVESNLRDVSALAQGSVMAVLQFVVAMFILYHLLRDRELLVRRVRGLMPTTAGESDRVMNVAADSIHANLYANFLTSVIDGVGGGLVFWLLGLPAPVTWGFVLFVLSFIPMFGTWLVWGPATAYLALSGYWPEAIAMLVWGLTSAFVVGWLLYTRFLGKRMRLHQVPTLLAFLGGLAVFGVAGIVLGPVILAVTVALLEVWHARATAEPADTTNGRQRLAEPTPAA